MFFKATLLMGTFVLAINAQNTQVCPRFAPGSTITAPEDLYSKDGVLSVKMTYQTSTDASGLTLFCFLDSNGAQSPTLHVNPGDRLSISVTNSLATAQVSMPMPGMQMHASPDRVTSTQTCGSQAPMSPSSVNLHFHGTNTPPTCHQDEVIRTLINPGETFDYNLDIPSDEPPGLYWYHPHVHGISEAAVQGGASGAIIVEGIQNVNPAVAGLTQQLLVVRDNNIPSNPTDPSAPSWDVSLNYVPIPYPTFSPAAINIKPGEQQLWRVLNASADTILDLQVQYDGKAQNLVVVGMDGVPTGSQDGTTQGKGFPVTDIMLPPAGRAEFIVTGPPTTVASAQLLTLNIDTGPQGDTDPERPLAVIRSNPLAAVTARAIPKVSAPPPAARFPDLARVTPTAKRTLYLSEIPLNLSDPDSGEIFYITVVGQPETSFDPNNPPAITTTQGAVEDWTIENHAMELHAFHIHQIHFLLMAQNGVPVENPQFMDTVNVPYWSGTGPYPSITVRMDFRGAVIGDFVYHCHILAHEDAGMMATIRVNPAPAGRRKNP
jgi:FtsP/CotA-like multicopper oxidase with cupredoxin domain